MVTEKSTIKCEAVFNEEHTHRFLWKRIWSKDKPIAAVIMLNPYQSDNVIMDTSTSLVVNNIARLEDFGGVAILNLYSRITPKLSFQWHSDEDLNQPENDDIIRKAAQECACVIIAWGKSAHANKRIQKRANAMMDILKAFPEKVFLTSDGRRDNLHPLTPTLRKRWIIKPYDWESEGTPNVEATGQETPDEVK